MWVAMQNPPLSSYYVAAVGSVADFGELAPYLAFLLPALAAMLGTFALVRWLWQSPVTARCRSVFNRRRERTSVCLRRAWR